MKLDRGKIKSSRIVRKSSQIVPKEIGGIVGDERVKQFFVDEMRKQSSSAETPVEW